MLSRRARWTLVVPLALGGVAAPVEAQPPARLGPPAKTVDVSTWRPAVVPAAAQVVAAPSSTPVLPVPTPTTPGVVPPTTMSSDLAMPVTFPNVLGLALLANLDIQQSNEVVAQARAALLRSNVAWVPSLNLGSAYNHHEGNIQKTEGNIIQANRDSLFVGGGPSITLQISDAIFAPRIARHLTTVGEAAFQRVSNETLLAVADAYLNVLRARRRLGRIDETMEYLTSDVATPLRAGSKGLLPLVRDYVQVGRKDALKSDLARVEVEVLRRQEERRATVQEFVVAQAELARLVRIDPRTPLWPGEDFRVPMTMPVSEWVGQPLDALIAFALRNRPELAESDAQVRAAVERVQAARFRPFLPNVSLAYNWGGYGGGPDLKPTLYLPPTKPGGNLVKVTQTGFGPSGRINHFGDRTDFDAAIYWRLQNFGFGNYAEVREQQAAERQSVLRLVQAQDRVSTQVVQTTEQIDGWRQRLDTTRTALFDKDGKPAGPVFQSVQLNFDRIRAAEARPLEVLDSIRSLNDTLEAYGQAMTEYERSQFRLLIAVGLPARTILSLFPQVLCAPGSASKAKP